VTELTNIALREHAYQMSMVASAIIESMGMLSENIGTPKKFDKNDFESLIEKYQLSHNQVLSNWLKILED
jgi:hypothetical protein